MEQLRMRLIEGAFFSEAAMEKGAKSQNLGSGKILSPWDSTEAKAILSQILQDCHHAIDNRDFSVIPNLQPRGSPGIISQTSLGPPLAAKWLWTMAITYARIVLPDTTTPDHPFLGSPDFFSENAEYEIRLYKFGEALHCFLLPQTNFEKLQDQADHLLEFFNFCDEEAFNVMGSQTDSQGYQLLPSRLLEIIHCVCEGFCLFRLAHESAAKLSAKSHKNLAVVKSTRMKILPFFTKLAQAIQSFIDSKKWYLIDIEKKGQGAAQGSDLFSKLQDVDKEYFGSKEKWHEYLAKIHEEQHRTFCGALAILRLLASDVPP